MPRTFSLGRLMVGVSVFCVLCGWAGNYPNQALAFAAIAGFFAPTFLVWLILVSRSKRRGSLSFMSLVGAACGLVFSWALVELWQDIAAPFVGAVLPALGALVFGGFILLGEAFFDQPTQ